MSNMKYITKVDYRQFNDSKKASKLRKGMERRKVVKNLKRREHNGSSSLYLLRGFCKNKPIKRINLLQILPNSFCTYNETHLNKYLINA